MVSVTTFKDDDEALSIANDTLYGLGAGVWSRDANRCYRFGRATQGRPRLDHCCRHAYPAHAAFGGYKHSGIGRENHKMMLDHYQQTARTCWSATAQRSSVSSDRPSDLRGAAAFGRVGAFDFRGGHLEDKVSATPAALKLIAEIIADHGPVLFHQSGGC